jgi:IclR family acetate operon transcriptional repressor
MRNEKPMPSSDPTTPARPKNLVQAIERAAAILELLGQFSQGLSVGDVAARTGLPKGTAHRLLSSLVFFDFVRQEAASKRYRLGFKLVELGNKLLDHLDLRENARPFLIALAEEAQETVHLVVLDQTEALYIDKVALHPKRSGLQMVSRVGARTALHSSAVGKVLLADLPEERVAQILRQRGLSKQTDKTIVDAAELAKHLAIVRRQGFAVDDEENEKGIRCVGAPIRDAAGTVVAALSVSGPTARVTRSRVARSLQRKVCDAAVTVSRQLGFRDEPA